MARASFRGARASSTGSGLLSYRRVPIPHPDYASIVQVEPVHYDLLPRPVHQVSHRHCAGPAIMVTVWVIRARASDHAGLMDNARVRTPVHTGLPDNAICDSVDLVSVHSARCKCSQQNLGQVQGRIRVGFSVTFRGRVRVYKLIR